MTARKPIQITSTSDLAVITITVPSVAVDHYMGTLERDLQQPMGQSLQLQLEALAEALANYLSLCVAMPHLPGFPTLIVQLQAAFAQLKLTDQAVTLAQSLQTNPGAQQETDGEPPTPRVKN